MDCSGGSGRFSADGGHGILTGYNINLGSLSPALQVQGGHGGTVTSSSLGQSATANGGNGFDYQGLNLDLINYPQPRDISLTNVIDHGTFIGGNGGAVVGQAGECRWWTWSVFNSSNHDRFKWYL